MVEYARAIQKVGVSILIDAGAFSYNNREKDLVNYELALPSKYTMSVKRICLYHQNDFNKLSKEQKLKLLNHHGIAFKI
jgi:hypothetical protein